MPSIQNSLDFRYSVKSLNQMALLQTKQVLNFPILCSPITSAQPKFKNHNNLLLLSLNRTHNCVQRVRAVSYVEEILPNAGRRKKEPLWRGGFSLGVDLGLSRTGVALSKGFYARPLTILNLRGQKLELRLLEIAQKEEADEFIVGLPKSSDGKETTQSNKVRSVAGRLAVRAAERGWRVYLLDEHRTSSEAMELMVDRGLFKPGRRRKADAYAAAILLERYFSSSGLGAEIVLPKNMDLQEKLRKGALKDIDLYPEELNR